MSYTEQIKQAVEQYEVERARMMKQLEGLVVPAFAQLFADFPNVQAIRWTQYTPWFNDGDPCVFSANDPDVLLSESKPEPVDWDGEEGWHYCWGRDKAPEVNAVAELCGAIPREVKEQLWGDHMEIRVERADDGVTVSTEEYDHD